MNRLVLGLGLCAALAGCSTATPATQPQASPVPPTQRAAPASETSPPAPTPTAARVVGPNGVVVYGFGDGIWAVNTDGTNAHELVRGVTGSQPLAWSRDGSRLLYGTQHGVALTDAAGSEPVEFELQCPVGADSDAVLVSCQADMSGVAFAPEGNRLAYPISEGTHDQGNREVTSVLVVLDLATGLATRLEMTRTTTPSPACGTAGDQVGNHSPSWSPDGTRLAFARGVTGSESRDDCPEALLTVNADGSNVRQVLAPGQLRGRLRPFWSPDGASILVDAIANYGTGTTKGGGGNIYAVLPDGTGLTALTSDGASVWPSWTRDGRIVFVRWLSPADSGGNPWVMDADGGNATRLEASIPSLTAAGCLTCAYPYANFDRGGHPLNGRETPPLRKYETTTLLWQPVDQP